MDIAFDTIGLEVLQSCFHCVKPYGDVVTILQPLPDTNWSEARKRNVRLSLELMFTSRSAETGRRKFHQSEILRKCTALFDANKFSVEIARTFELLNAAAAQHLLEQDHPADKLVMVI